MKRVAIIIFSLLVVPIYGWASIIYLNASTGNDGSGDGSSGNPYQTFDKGYTTATAGDTLDLTGTFDWSVQTTNIASPTGYTLAKNLTIQGQGIDNTYIQAQASKGTSIDRMVFYINNVDVAIEGVTIRYGYLTTNGAGYGAGVSVIGSSASLTTNGCKFFENVYSPSAAAIGTAGGIGMTGVGATLVMDDCIVDSNERLNYQYYGAAGVACAQSGNITITNSIFSNNTTNVTSPVAGSSYSSPAGGLCMYRFSDLVLTNSTFINNTTNGAGGAMNLYYSYDFVLTNNTIVDNSVTGGNTGGGIAHAALASGHELVLKNNLIGNNSPEDLTTYEGTTARITDNGYNIIEVANVSNAGSGTYSFDASTITGNQTDLFGTGISATPALDDNNTNNNTQSIALSAGSVAIDAGDDATHSDANTQTTVVIPTTDQRGIGRSGTVDIGSYEKQPLVFPSHGGYALDFDGTDDYVDCGIDQTALGTDFTIEAWMYPQSGTNYKGVGGAHGGSNQGIVFGQFESGQCNFAFGNGSSFPAVSTSAVQLDEWNHVAAVYSSGNYIRLYVNGTFVGENLSVGSFSPYGSNFWIGRSYDNVDRYFDGKIDEVRIWSDIRTQAEIQANMHKELSGGEANLVAYYDMYDGSGTSVADNSSSGLDGTLTNGPVWKASSAHAGSGMGLDFDGSDDYVLSSVSSTATSTLTIETWVSFSSLGGQENFFTFHQGVGLNRIIAYKSAANQVFLYVYDGSVYNIASSFSISQSDEWHHFAFVYDAGEVSIYADGNLVQTASSQGSFTTSTANNFYIGADLTAPGYYSDVKMDEVRVWDDVRTEAEIRANKDRVLDGDEDNLLAYYRFDQQADAAHTTLYDQTANGNDGTLTNMTPASDWVVSDPFNTWVGADDSDWNNADNWSNGSVPDSDQDVGVFTWLASNAPASANISGQNIYVAANASLSHSGNLTLTEDFYNAGTFTTTGNVTFSGSEAQTIRGTGTTTFGTFTVNNSKGVVLATDLGVTSDLALTSGVVNLGGQTLTLGSSASVSGSPASGNHVNATSGTLRKSYSGTGSFAFPVGDATLYSPITLNFTSGTFSSAYADVDLTIAKHPENISTGHYLSRYWTVSSSGISAFSCDVTAAYADGDITGTESELHGGKWDGSAWLDLGSATPASNQITGTVSGFSDFTGGQPYAFPVEWLNFSAKPEANSVLLDWTTASEQNSDFFAIERSGNLEQWEELGTQAAAGNSSYQLDYQYEDAQPLAGTAWYRLRQVDLDGSFQYSSTLAIHFAGAGIVVYPNPVKDRLTIEVPNGQQLSVELINLQGQQVWQQQLTDGVQQLSLSELPSGLYTLRMRTEQNGETSYQIVKQ